MHPLAIHLPVLGSQERRDPAIAVPRMMPHQLQHPFHQRSIPVRIAREIPLCRTRLSEHLARPTLRHLLQGRLRLLHRLPAARRAYHFPLIASSRICLSSVRSATAFFSRRFSISSSFKCLASLAFIPPY